jgi:hypothetical protein
MALAHVAPLHPPLDDEGDCTFHHATAHPLAGLLPYCEAPEHRMVNWHVMDRVLKDRYCRGGRSGMLTDVA